MNTFDGKHFGLSHLAWIFGVSVAVVAFYQWRGEHHARLQAEPWFREDIALCEQDVISHWL